MLLLEYAQFKQKKKLKMYVYYLNVIFAHIVITKNPQILYFVTTFKNVTTLTFIVLFVY